MVAITTGIVIPPGSVELNRLNSGTEAQIIVCAVTTGIPTYVSVTGDVTTTSLGVTAITAGSIINADINSAAAIAFSKLAALTSANILVGNVSNVATAVAVTGDISLTNGGVTAIVADTIVNADINSTAAIAFSKLAAGLKWSLVAEQSFTNASSDTFSSLSGQKTYKILLFMDRTDAGGTAESVQLRFNGDGTSVYDFVNGATANNTQAGIFIADSSNSATDQVIADLTIFARSSTFNNVSAGVVGTSYRLNNAPTGDVGRHSGQWRPAAQTGVTSIGWTRSGSTTTYTGTWSLYEAV